ncbi:MAG: hypothetical protein JKY94_07785 [Rhodobacteraceae bacterium]|nr:hypothetical protein [Paracoccaceae bacterium]
MKPAETTHFSSLEMLVILALISLQFQPFLTGYYLTADDILFHYWAMTRPPVEWFKIGWETVLWKAKLGEFLSIPTMILGNLHIDALWMRILNLLIFVSSFVVLSFYLSTVFGRRLAVLALIAIVALSPLRFFHMTPTSFPLFLSLQFIVGIISLMALRRSGNGRRIAFAVLFLALISSEYTLFFIGALTVFDAIQIIRRRSTISFLSFVAEPRLIAVFLAFATHVIVRNWVGSGDYTAVSGLTNPMDLFSVQLFHTLNGTILGSASFDVSLAPKGALEVVRAILVGGLTYYLVCSALGKPGLNRGNFITFFAFCVFVIFCITFPIALLEKYRIWCSSPAVCVYLDSRYAGWFLAIFLGGCLAFVRQSRVTRICSATAFALLAVITSLHNGTVSQAMVAARAPWVSAEIALCQGNISWNTFLDTEYATNIPFHITENRSRNDYWKAWADTQPCTLEGTQ